MTQGGSAVNGPSRELHIQTQQHRGTAILSSVEGLGGNQDVAHADQIWLRLEQPPDCPILGFLTTASLSTTESMCSMNLWTRRPHKSSDTSSELTVDPRAKFSLQISAWPDHGLHCTANSVFHLKDAYLWEAFYTCTPRSPCRGSYPTRTRSACST